MINLRIVTTARSLSFCLAVLVSSCTTVPDPGVKPPSPPVSTAADVNKALLALAAQSSASLSNYQIGPEDLLQITLFNIPESESRVTPRMVTLRVNQNGSIMLPLLGEINVKGLTVAGLEQNLRAGYDRFIRNPQIGVLVTEYRQRISVIGAVQKPGLVELTGPKTLIDVLAMVGGVTDKAGSQVHVYRNTAEGRQSYVIDLTFLVGSMRPAAGSGDEGLINMPIHVGDVLNVPEAGKVFIDGAVKTAGSFPLPRRSTLTQTLLLAGGVDFELADYSGVTIFRRRTPGEVETTRVDLNEIQAGKAPDPMIEPDDTIVVPISTAKYFLKRYVGIIISGNVSPFMFR